MRLCGRRQNTPVLVQDQTYGVYVVLTVLGSTLRLATRMLTIFTIITALSGLAAGNVHAKQAYSGVVIDAKTGKVLYGHQENSKRFPASLTKMMTLYMLFDAMEQGKVSNKTRIQFSRHAASMQPSKLGVPAGSSISAEQAIYALVTKSANDAAAAVAEHLGGTESKFGEMMTRKAHQLGMKSTVFRNASGLPDSRQVTTARDMAILGIALREHFPGQYRYFATPNFKFGKHNFRNHNRLLGTIRGYDGIKTGYTRASGFNLVSSVESNGRSIVAVVMGGRTGKSRNEQMTKLINQYLPRASKGRDRMIVARNGSKPTLFASLFNKPEKAPLPEKRPSVSPVDTVVTASVVPAPSAYVESQPEPVIEAAVESAAAPAQGGWHVQIGAMPSQENAISQLEKARAKLPGLLENMSNYTETVQSNGATLYRARFAGFSSKSAAWDACAKLKSVKFNCLALEQ